MNIAQNIKISAFFQRPTQQPRILEIIKGDPAVAFEAQVQQVEILCDDGCSGTRKVKRERVFDGSQIVELEDKVLGEMGFVAPDDPSNTDVYKTELVATRSGRYKSEYARCSKDVT
jgi:hypothetical protein